MFGYRVPAPSQAMLISGGKQRTAEGGDVLPFRIVVGNGAFVVPVVRKASFLTLAMRESVVNEECVSQQGIALRVSAVIAFKVGSDEPRSPRPRSASWTTSRRWTSSPGRSSPGTCARSSAR